MDVVAVNSPGEPPGEETLGSAAEEAAKLAAALQDFVRRATGDRVATGSDECRLCPICQLISLVRDSNPAVVEHLTIAAQSLGAAIAAAVSTYQRPDRPGDRPGHAGSAGSAGSAGLQHIDIGE
jgi:hypothetical protein